MINAIPVEKISNKHNPLHKPYLLKQIIVSKNEETIPNVHFQRGTSVLPKKVFK